MPATATTADTTTTGLEESADVCHFIAIIQYLTFALFFLLHKQQQRPFQTEGPPALKSMRLWILHDSLVRAQQRLLAAKQKSLQPQDEVAESAQFDAMSTTFKVCDSSTDRFALVLTAHLHLQKFVIVASEPSDDRCTSGVAFSPTGEYLATSGWSGVCKLWKTKEKKVEFTLKGTPWTQIFSSRHLTITTSPPPLFALVWFLKDILRGRRV